MHENACGSIRCGVGEHADASTILISPESMEARYRPASPAGVPVSAKVPITSSRPWPRTRPAGRFLTHSPDHPSPDVARLIEVLGHMYNTSH